MTSSSTTAAPTRPRRHRFLGLKIVAALVVIVGGGAALWVWGTLHFAYSTGERTGYVQKLSHKGWLCKTWEGELAMTPVPGSPPQIFNFSVRSDSIASVIEAAAGKQVVLSYSQHKGVPSPCFGETEYFIEGVRVLLTPGR